MASLSYNGLDLNTSPYHVQSIDGLLGSPEIASADKPKVSMSGMISGIDKYRGRSVVLALEVVSSNEIDFNTAVNNFKIALAAPTEITPLVFTIPGVANGIQAFLNARPRKVSLPVDFMYQDYAGVANVEFYATDALIYSYNESAATLNVFQPASGRTYNRTYNVTYGTGGFSGTTHLINNGSAVAPVLIRIYGPVTNPTLTNITTGQSLALTAIIVAGTYVEINTAKRTIMLDGTADRYSYLTTPEWWGLIPGSNEIRYFAQLSTGSFAEIYYRSAWI